MSRDNDMLTFQARNPATSTAGTVTSYFSVGSRPILIRNHLITGINPSDTDGDTLASEWDYSVTGAGGATWVTIDDEAAFEYNDTTDTNALGDIGDSTAATVVVGADVNIRVPAYALIRHQEITAGTITGIQANCFLEYIVL
jgi:hypothetical protein